MSRDWKEQVTYLLRSAVGASIVPYSNLHNVYDEHTHRIVSVKNTDCISVVVDEPTSCLGNDPLCEIYGFSAARQYVIEILDRLRPPLPTGTVCFIGKGGVELVVGPGADQFDILRLAQSNAINYELDTEALISELRRYDALYGIDIFRAERSIIEFRVKQLPPDLRPWVTSLDEFCPDIIGQYDKTIETWSEAIEKTGRVFLWWD